MVARCSRHSLCILSPCLFFTSKSLSPLPQCVSPLNDKKALALLWGDTWAWDAQKKKNQQGSLSLSLTRTMPPRLIKIYADRQWVNESLQKRKRSKMTELRPSNEDLGRNPANLLIVWQAVRAPASFFPPSIPFTLMFQTHTEKAVWALMGL